jgi:hypothetical protein
MLCFLTLSSNAQEKINTTKNESELTNNCFLFGLVTKEKDSTTENKTKLDKPNFWYKLKTNIKKRLFICLVVLFFVFYSNPLFGVDLMVTLCMAMHALHISPVIGCDTFCHSGALILRRVHPFLLHL